MIYIVKSANSYDENDIIALAFEGEEGVDLKQAVEQVIQDWLQDLWKLPEIPRGFRFDYIGDITPTYWQVYGLTPLTTTSEVFEFSKIYEPEE